MEGDKDIEALYQLPLKAFTPSRNALAKARGPAGRDIRTLEKPSVPAWAVNQLFWQHRDAYQTLIARAGEMRAAHAALLSGRTSDVAAAEAAHRDAIRNATALIRAVLQQAGEAASPATLDAISETLQALPSDDTPGQLTRPLKPLGFGALMALGIQGGADSQGSRSEVRGPRSEVRGSRSDDDAGAREEARRRKAELAKQRKALERSLRAAEKAEQEADAALALAEKAHLQLERDHAALRDRLLFLDKQRTDAEQVLRQRSQDARNAANARLQASQALRALDQEDSSSAG